ncbi:MAG: Type secretion ATPase inhibitor [Parachlamydiales bacterium]|nr:Type secretion ATPase inhibitor [Parachlamydiales bacterium]
MKFFSLLSQKDVHIAPNQKIIPASECSELQTAHDILKTVKHEAGEYRKNAVIEAEKIKEQGFQEGFQEGLTSLDAHIVALDHELKQIRDEIHKKILPLALKAARKIIGEELKLHQDRIVDIVLTALKPVTQHKKIVLYVNRADLEALEKQRSKIKKIFEHLDSFSLQERSDIEPGGCIIETEAGIINAQLENQFRALESAFDSFMKK